MHIDDKIINFYLNKNYCNFLIKIIAMNTPAYSEKNKTPFFSLYSFFLFLSVLICITGFLSCDIRRENEEEEERSSHEHLRQRAAVLRVHEEQDDERGLRDRDADRHREVERAKVDKRHGDRDGGQYHQRAEDGVVGALG